MSEEVADRVQAYLGRRARRRTPARARCRALRHAPLAMPRIAQTATTSSPDFRTRQTTCAAAVEHEFACTIADVLVRRTHLAFETRDHGASVAPRSGRVARAAARLDLQRHRARARRLPRRGRARLFTIEMRASPRAGGLDQVFRLRVVDRDDLDDQQLSRAGGSFSSTTSPFCLLSITRPIGDDIVTCPSSNSTESPKIR